MFDTFKKHKHHNHYNSYDDDDDEEYRRGNAYASSDRRRLPEFYSPGYSHSSKQFRSSTSPDFYSHSGKHSSKSSSSSYPKRRADLDDEDEWYHSSVQKKKEPSYKKNRYQTLVLKVQFQCEACVRKVKKALAEIDGVESIIVDAKRKRVSVTGYIDPKQLLKKVAKTGKAVEIVSSSNSYSGSSKYADRTSSLYPGLYHESSSSKYGGAPSAAYYESSRYASPYEQQHSRFSGHDSFNDNRRVVMPTTFLSEEDPNACSIM